ncbi:MAG: hypothetical protein AB1489_07890, partial [Acidobacteriota bacterium]
MRSLVIIIFLFTLCLSLPTTAKQDGKPRTKRVKTVRPPKRAQKYNCLPEDVKLIDVVATEGIGKDAKKITVENRLNEMKAQCQGGKLVDANGKEIYFYRLIGCWGNPPFNYRELLQNQQEELKELRKKY